MGLDMYAYKTKSRIPKPVDFSTDGMEIERIAYWRKFNNLHGWMAELYDEKGGVGDFNCEPVELDSADLDRLEADARTEEGLKPTSGFFFGGQEDFNSDMRNEVLDFVSKARQAIADGYSVFYDSWW